MGLSAATGNTPRLPQILPRFMVPDPDPRPTPPPTGRRRPGAAAARRPAVPGRKAAMHHADYGKRAREAQAELDAVR